MHNLAKLTMASEISISSNLKPSVPNRKLIVATPSLRLLQVDECFKPFCNSACPHTMRAVTKPRMEYEHQHSYWAIMHCCTVAHKLPAREVGYHSV